MSLYVDLGKRKVAEFEDEKIKIMDNFILENGSKFNSDNLIFSDKICDVYSVKVAAPSLKDKPRTNDISKSLIEGFRKCNASRAGSNLLFLMDIVFGGLIREVEINCGCNPSLNKDEINFLELFSISQNQGDIESKIRSLDFLNDIAVRNAAPLFTDYAISLRDAGLILTFGKKGSLMRKLAAHSMEVSTKMH